MKAANDNTKAGSAIDNYNNDVAEAHNKAIHGLSPWEHQTPRTTMSDFLATAANDNTATEVA
jgi:hypothetical protein